MKKLFSALLVSALVFSSYSPSYSAVVSPSADQVIDESIEISGVEEGGAYNVNVTPVITASGAYTATLDRYYSFKSGDTISAEGTHTLVVKLASGTEKKVTFKIDKRKPTYKWSNVNEKLKEVPKLYIYSYEDEQVQLFYTINDVPYSDIINGYQNYYFKGITEDGPYTISFYTIDRAGNQSEVTTASFTIDSKAPEIWVRGVEEEGVYRVTAPEFGSNDGTVTARLNYDNYQSGTPITKHGSYTLTIEAKDSVNNRSEKRVRFNIDAKGPEIRGNYYGYIDNDDNYSVTQPLALKFSEEMNISTINEKAIQMKNMDTGQLEALDFSKVSQELQDNYNYPSIVHIPFKEKLKANSNYRLTIDTTKMEDRVGNVMVPANNNTIISIDIKTRKFYDSPEIVKTNFDSSVINSASNLMVYFADDIDRAKVNKSQIYLTNVNTGLREELNIYVNGEVLTVEPKLGLTESTPYQLMIQSDAILSRDNIHMKSAFIKEFKTAELFKVVTGPDKTTNEKRPKFAVSFSNPIDSEYVNNRNFKLFENDNSNKNDEIELHLSLTNNGKSVEVYPLTALREDSKYKLVVNNNLLDIYGLKLVDKEPQIFPIEVGSIKESIAKPTSPTWSALGFNAINLTFTDNSLGEEGYYIEIDGNPNNSDYIPSVTGKSSTVHHRLIFDRPAGTHSIRIIPVINDGEEDYDNAITLKNIKLLIKKPAKPADIKVKLLKDGTLEWTWKDVPSDYEGAASYIIIRNTIKEKISSDNRVRSNEGRLLEKLDISKEKVVNNVIHRYISRSVNVEGASGDDFESDKVLYKIKLPAKAPTATAKTYEYDMSENTLKFSWTMKDSKNTAKRYKYIIKKNNQTVATSDTFEITTGKTTYTDTLDYYYFSNNPGEVWQVIVVTMNSVGVETHSVAAKIKAVK
jgi:hypothetical protein